MLISSERNYEENESQKDQKTSQMNSIPDSTLAPPIQEVLRLIFSQELVFPFRNHEF